MSQRASKITADQSAAARAIIEAGGTWAEAADAAGCAYSTMRDHARREGWQRPEVTAEQRAERTRPARERHAERWSQRRASEADAAGETAAKVREAGEKAMGKNNPQMVRACGIFYGILVDKAQLLSGGATGRVDNASPEQRRQRTAAMRDDLAVRRDQKSVELPVAETG